VIDNLFAANPYRAQPPLAYQRANRRPLPVIETRPRLMANVAATSVAVKPCVTISRAWE
jgi:hypothetical protein